MIKVTFEFPTVDAAIVALGKLSSVAPAVSKTAAAVTAPLVASAASPAAPVATEPKQRQPRADKGKPRGSYKNAGAEQAQTGSPQAASGSAPAPNATEQTQGNAAQPAHGSSGGESPIVSASRPGAEASVSVAPTTVLQELLKKPKLAAEDAQAALSAIFEAHGLARAQEVMSRFGARRLRDMDPGVYAEFIQAAIRTIKTGEA